MIDYLAERAKWWPVSPELLASYKFRLHTGKLRDHSQEWRKAGNLHRGRDKPTWIEPDGTLFWLNKNQRRHRNGDKPAVIWNDGTLEWFKNGFRHRDGDRPAVIGSDGSLEWWKNGQWHRTRGPAVIRTIKKKEYWINGKNITAEVNAWLKHRKYKYPFTPEQQVEFALTFC
jgi:hypothetical protein